MKLKRRHNVSTKETCGFVACFLLIFFTVSQILVITHRSSGMNATVEKRQESEEVATRAVKSAADRALGNHVKKKSAKVVRQPVAKSGEKASREKARSHLQQELRRMEKSLTLLVRQNSMPPEDASAHFLTEVSVIQLKEMIRRSEAGLVSPARGNLSGDSTRRWLFDLGNRTDRELDGDAASNDSLTFKQAAGSSNQKEWRLFPPGEGAGGGGARRRGVLNKDPSSSDLARRFHDFDRSEEFDLERTVMKSLAGETDGGGEGGGGGGGRDDEVIQPDADDDETMDWDKEAFLAEIQGGNRVCKEIPDGLVGPVPNVQLGADVDVTEIIKAHADIAGGEWKPADCISRHRLAIIVPYRDRWSHLKVLLNYLLPILKRQQVHFRVFVVEQYGNQTFNKGRIMNAAFREAMKMFNFHCVIFHDVDLVPEDDRNMYSCAEYPKHMSTAIDKFGYMLPYQGLVGGVLSFRAEHFQAVNGYSNMYWGWGGEDDDMTVRILHRGLRILRPPNNVARYKMVKHGSRQLSELRLKLLRTAARRSRVEGLNNVPYKLMFTHSEKLFTHFMVDVGKP